MLFSFWDTFIESGAALLGIVSVGFLAVGIVVNIYHHSHKLITKESYGRTHTN